MFVVLIRFYTMWSTAVCWAALSKHLQWPRKFMLLQQLKQLLFHQNEPSISKVSDLEQ